MDARLAPGRLHSARCCPPEPRDARCGARTANRPIRSNRSEALRRCRRQVTLLEQSGPQSILVVPQIRGLPKEDPMRRLLLTSLAACVLVTTSILSALAMPVANQNMLGGSDGVVLVRG